MKFYSLLKPVWALPTLSDGKPNPKFIQEIPGEKNIEGIDFSEEFLKEKNELGYGVYFFPNHPSKNVYDENSVKYLNGTHIDVFNFIFCDMDLKDEIYPSKEAFYEKLKEFPLLPSMVVDSGNGVHAYWRVSDLNREAYVLAQMALMKHFQTDESVWTVKQLLRYPGYWNTKHKDNPKLSAVIDDLSSANVYELKDFPEGFFNLPQDRVRRMKLHLDKLDGKTEVLIDTEAASEELPEKFLKLLVDDKRVRNLFEDPKSYGDRSAADMALANILYSKKFDINEAFTVLCNTQKALEKGANRQQYARLSLEKVYSDRPKYNFRTVGDYLRDEKSQIKEPLVNGPYYLDSAVLGEPWRRKELLGLIAGAGVGKTAFALNIIKEMICNNPHSEDIYVFFSLEMTKGQVIKRWVKMVGENSDLANRLFVIDTQNEDGSHFMIGLQEIFNVCSELKQVTGKQIGSIVIDHFHILSSHVDARIHPNFNINAEQNTGRGDVRNLSFNGLATQLKTLVKLLNTFGIILTQTTKEKGIGDLPVGKDGAYGVSQFEWIVDRIISIWQPLMRVQSSTKTNFLAWQYAKIREKHPNDKVKELDPKLLTYDMATGDLRITSSDEYQEFVALLPMANELREASKKKEPKIYSIQLNLSGIEDKIRSIGQSQ